MDPRAGTAPEPPVAADGRRQLLALYEAHVLEVYRYLSRLTAGDRQRTEDLTQTVFERAAVALHRPGADVGVGAGWLIVIARNAFLQDLRRDGREQRRLARVGGWAAPTPFSTAGGEIERGLLVRAALRELGDEQRAAVVLRYHDDLAVAEIAERLGRSVEATESMLVRARARLRRAIEEADHGA